jgi:hypothetical protein
LAAHGVVVTLRQALEKKIEDAEKKYWISVPMDDEVTLKRAWFKDSFNAGAHLFLDDICELVDLTSDALDVLYESGNRNHPATKDIHEAYLKIRDKLYDTE